MASSDLESDEFFARALVASRARQARRRSAPAISHDGSFGHYKSTTDRLIAALDGVVAATLEREELSGLQHRRKMAIVFGRGISGNDTRRERELEVKLKRAEAAHAEEQRAQRRQAVVDVIAPAKTLHRPWIRKLIDHATDLILEHQLSFQWDGRRPRASRAGRIVYSDLVMTERAYSTFLHEAAHIVAPTADSCQQRHVFSESSIASPAAECFAWRWAIDTARASTCWTSEMQNDLAEALSSYQGRANYDEREQIAETIRYGAQRAVPPPDSLEGRERRAAQIRRETTIRNIERDLRVAEILRRYRVS